jgi:hypothetical protein
MVAHPDRVEATLLGGDGNVAELEPTDVAFHFR